MKSKEKRHEQKLNGLIFVVFWVFIMTALKMGLYGISNGLYETVAVDFPIVLQRLWVFMLMQAGLSALVIGVAQKAAIQFLKPLRLQNWMRLNLLVGLGIGFMQYLFLRFYPDGGLPPLAMGLEVPVFLLAQWFILKNHFKHSSIWLAMLLPIFSLNIFRTMIEQPIFIDALQALITSSVLLWMIRHEPVEEKAKNTELAERHLADESFEEDAEAEEETETGYAIAYHVSKA